MNYGDIQTQLSGLLKRSDCSTSQLQTFISLGIQRIQRELRCPALEKYTTVTIVSGYAGLVIPGDFLELIDLVPVSVNPADQMRMEKCDISQAIQLSSQFGTPRKYARAGGLWVLGPSPVVGDQITVGYYAELTPLVNATDSNIGTVSFPDLLIYSALSLAGDYFVDKRTPQWEARYTQIRDTLNAMAETDDDSGAAAVQPAYVYPSNDGEYVGGTWGDPY